MVGERRKRVLNLLTAYLYAFQSHRQRFILEGSFGLSARVMLYNSISGHTFSDRKQLSVNRVLNVLFGLDKVARDATRWGSVSQPFFVYVASKHTSTTEYRSVVEGHVYLADVQGSISVDE